ncbi:MAG TPA: translocation/assembly module TamB domain-containing protein, partial [Castellaniella sp.]|nr:translocation/assembly module TamB domain-containing protein [Castellaniella sp.]
RILSVDQGIRLLDGTLQAHLAGMHIVLDHLHFPAVRRVTPKEWRTATWISENPDAQNGSLDVTGDWDLYQQQGQVRIAFRRYPILQRADRYAMVSGDVSVQAGLPAIRVSGKIVADAGWFDLDMLNNIPSLDGDVVVLQPGKPVAPAPATPLDLSVDMTVDLGPRFYLTGYGVNSGLVGSLDLRMRQGRLTALGALRTRGGSIDVYGQHLQLRRGTVTFQGDIANPVLSIEALRTDVAVQAGVRVAGTARRPRIDLVSHPDVSETEKLTWLLLGHGPDQGGGGDMSLLFSVGSSFLSGGEPFYKRFGLDELSIRSGALGSTGSVLPAQSVVTDLDTGASPAEQQFALASKTLTDNLKVSLEQSLAQTGTVARLSYRILRRLQAEVTVGTVSGLALVYRWFSMD